MLHMYWRETERRRRRWLEEGKREQLYVNSGDLDLVSLVSVPLVLSLMFPPLCLFLRRIVESNRAQAAQSLEQTDSPTT